MQADAMSTLQDNTPRVLHAHCLGTANSVLNGPPYVKYREAYALLAVLWEKCSIRWARGHRPGNPLPGSVDVSISK